ncbi:hypothetical protein [uncultured Mediterranean phage uvMED]|nr:hypothetical protein [uncultured Mediterranean phage uvMED]BAQ87775.1 hypothetical protein [uncultured Mediterranean phage uvMED]|tara:strand:- start:417 stop:722 length:306 start_codon:yes stop_codon:yes gene_type:complete
MFTLKKKSNIDYAAPHIRQQAFRMRLLKFYKTIEFNDDVYNHNATMILKGTLPYRFVNEIERLRLEHEKKKKEKWDKIKKRGATTLGLQVRDIIKRSTQER